MEERNPNPKNIFKNKKINNNNNSSKNYEFCNVCKLNHNVGRRRHNYFPNHIKSLSNFLSRFQSKLSEIRIYIKNPKLIVNASDINNKSFWCVFCECDVTEFGTSFVREKAIGHLASADHLKNLKHFMWKYGGGMDRVDHFRVSEADLAKYEMKCIAIKREGGGEQSRGLLIGPSYDIHNELKFDYVDNLEKNCIDSHIITFPNGVLPLQNHTNENYQVSYSDRSGGAATNPPYDFKSLPLTSDAKPSNNLRGRGGSAEGYHHNGLGKRWQVYAEESEANGEGSSAGLQKLTRISSTIHEVDAGNVHSGAPPPWFDTTSGIYPDLPLKPVHGMDPVKVKTIKSKLNPKRVGAAWAEKRKMEMEMERRGELPVNRFDANWLPNFGRVWQSGSRKDSRKEFEVEANKPVMDEIQSDSSFQLQPYISKRMRLESER
uniref:TITAN-like protein n=1 Tax=Erigeron canadensis TaxID=72917 RepID=UPI001CB9114C|nr:TITAN-like protein [Erigeron canadensis]